MRCARRARALIAVALAAALVASGCTGAEDSNDNSNKAPDKVTYITSFGNFGRDAYVWVAKQKGYFKDAGIDVTIEPGTGTTNVQLVASGKAQFTAVDFSGAILQVTKATSPLNIRAVGAIQQHSMAAIMALGGTGITAPKDLANKTVADTPGSVVKLLFPTYAKLAGVDSSKVTFITGQAPQLPQMLAGGQVQAIGQFVIGKPTVSAVAGGKDVVVLPYSDFISDLYGNALWTTKSLIESKPDLVKRFRDALLRGLVDALNDPAGAGKTLAAAVPTAKAEAAAAELTLMKSYVEPVPNNGTVGSIDDGRVARMVAILQASGAIPRAVDPNELVDFSMAKG
jgi:NitT/TauT family transport system substrate-binding protein